METVVKYQGRGKICWLMVLAMVTTGGCTRNFYRERADKEAFDILKEKEKDPRWRLGEFSVYPDPRARFADFTNWDHPPTPFDDPYVKKYGPRPQKIKIEDYKEGDGWKKFLEDCDQANRKLAADRKKVIGQPEKINDMVRKDMQRLVGNAGPVLPLVDPSQSYEYKRELAPPVSQFDVNPRFREKESPPERPYLLGFNQAVELAVFNSREFQQKKEGLYLTALLLTQERFSFAAQFFAGETILRDQAGSNFTGTNALGEPAGRNWAYGTTGGVGKLFSTGALLLAQFANTTAVNLGNLAGTTPARVISQSSISLDIVQPFLRGGGRAVTLEPLTQSERNVVYAVRDYAKFRQEFYAYITVGQAAFIAGESAGVNAFTGGTLNLPSGSIPAATPVAQGLATPPSSSLLQVAPGSSGRLSINPSPGASAYGYMSTLLQKAQLYTYIKNVASFDYYFRLLKKYEEGGIVNPVQVYTIEQNWVQGIETMLSNWNQYRQSLDLFRIQLGLPTTLPLELDDEPIQPMYDLVDRYEKSSIYYAQAVEGSMDIGKPSEAKNVRSLYHKLLGEANLVYMDRFDKDKDVWVRTPLPFKTEGPQRWKAWEALSDAQLAARRKQMEGDYAAMETARKKLEAAGQLPSPGDKVKREDLLFELDLALFEATLRDYLKRAQTNDWKVKELPKQSVEDAQAARFLALHRSFVNLLAVPIRQRQAEITKSWPDLPPVFINEVDLLGAADDTAMNLVVKTALENRLDLMNQKAQLVDAWRQLAVAANALQGVFNVEYNMNATTPPNGSNPLAFSTAGTQHQLIFNAQLPLVRVAERNQYRSTLINYQQQRRAWQDSLDQVAFQVRFQLRNMRISAYNYHRVMKRKMELAYLVVDQSLQAFNQPLAPTGPTGLTNIGAPTPPTLTADPAALTLQLLQAQNTLVAAQNDLYSQWLGYLQNRISLYRDMGLMPLDSKGVWIEDVTYYHPASRDGSSNQLQCGDDHRGYLNHQTGNGTLPQGGSTFTPEERFGGNPDRFAPILLPPTEEEGR